LNVDSIGTGQAVNAAAAKNRTRADNPEDLLTFATVMNGNYASANAQTAQTFSFEKSSGAAARGTAAIDDRSSYAYRENRITTAQGETITDKISAADEKLDGFAEEVVETVAEDLDVGTEDVKEALAALGMTAFDLLIPENLAQAAMQITGEEDPAQLLLNAQFVDLMQDMNQMGINLLQAVDVAPGQLEELVAQMDILEEPVELTGEEAQVLLAASDDNPVERAAQEPVIETAQQPQSKTQEAVQQPDETLGEEEIQTGQEALPKAEETQAFSDEEQSGESGADGSRQTKTAGDPKTEIDPQIQIAADAVVDVTEEVAAPAEDTSYLSIDTMDLIEQIAENVRTSVSEGTSSIEMQLNPENLGKVYLQVTAKEGVVNATLAASNDAVRAALEAQVADLRQSLNQAGVKVDAIEVTVASHEFERNLEQNADSGKQQGEQAERQTGRRRSIALSSLDELSGVMSEEEALAAQIMRDNGNSVDLTA
jgi:flagellar hook-length control protein FliK